HGGGGLICPNGSKVVTANRPSVVAVSPRASTSRPQTDRIEASKTSSPPSPSILPRNMRNRRTSCKVVPEVLVRVAAIVIVRVPGLQEKSCASRSEPSVVDRTIRSGNVPVPFGWMMVGGPNPVPPEEIPCAPTTELLTQTWYLSSGRGGTLMCSTPSGDSMLVIAPSSETQNSNSVKPEPEVKQFVGASPAGLTRDPPRRTLRPGAPAAEPTPSSAASTAATIPIQTLERRLMDAPTSLHLRPTGAASPHGCVTHPRKIASCAPIS